MSLLAVYLNVTSKYAFNLMASNEISDFFFFLIAVCNHFTSMTCDSNRPYYSFIVCISFEIMRILHQCH